MAAADIKRLRGLLEGSDVEAQVQAAEELAKQGSDAQPALVSLVRRVGSSDEGVANWCTAALEEGGPPADDQVDALIELVADANADVAYWAATLLGRAGKRAASATGALKKRVSDNSSPAVKKRAEWALGKIGG